MPNPYVFAADFTEKYSDDEMKGIHSTQLYLNEIEVGLKDDPNNKFSDDFKQFKKHFMRLTDPTLYIESDENKKKYVQSAVWLENFMKNPVKAAALANCFEDYAEADIQQRSHAEPHQRDKKVGRPC